MHARVDELLSLRDGEPVGAEIAPHVAACAACTQEISRLRGLRRRLRALPAAVRPAGTWDAILGRAYPASAGRRRRQLAVFGTAASILVAASTAWILRDVPAGEPAARIADEAMKPDLVRRSMALEDALRALDYQPGIVRGSTAGTIAEIEDRIALVDYQLTHATGSQLTHTQSERLWRQRVDLLGSLVQVRYAQAQQAAY